MSSSENTTAATSTTATSSQDQEMSSKKNDDEQKPEIEQQKQQQDQAVTTSVVGAFSFSLPMSIPNFVIVSLTSIVGTLAIMQQVSMNPSNFTQDSDLSAGQVMAFLVVFWVLATFVCVHVKAAFDLLSSSNRIPVSTTTTNNNNEENQKETSPYTLSLRRIISDDQYNVLFAATEFSACLLLFFLCDRTKLIERTDKHYSRDTFFFLVVILFLGGAASLRKAPKPVSKKSAAVTTASAAASTASASSTAVVIDQQQQQQKQEQKSGEESEQQQQQQDQYYHISHLQRDQTEEWKGWMQVLFLWYHYFNAKEIYNLIRLFIAAYVWMTGFGNFSYYYIRKDFSLIRFCHMQWRLNFLVFWVCLLLQNEYMLYYICMLHTCFTVFIYAGLGIYHEVNQSFAGCVSKFVALTFVSLIIWDVPGVFEWAWWPLQPIIQFHNPYKTSQNIYYEWQFRSHLDHLVWIFGMFCAFNHPTWESWLKRLDSLSSSTTALAIKSAVVGVCGIALWIYYDQVFSLPKKEYNALHPYTSFIPIFIYIVLRNISQVARQWHMHMFEWLGKITLETYITQYHVWMATTGVNGSPKKLLAFLPKGYPLLDFVVASAISLLVSHRLFYSTNALKAYFLPSSLQPDALRKTLLAMTVALLAVYFGASGLILMSRGKSASSK